ncbi:MAG TPA: deoxyribonuclease IV, partial [Actinomycetota bacterium]|nr:deoxyribonuclease IV [Actinomycetota bacterium]
IEEARLRDADCVQIFVSNPRAWAGPRSDDAAAARFRAAFAASGLELCVAHLSYIGNVAAWNPEVLRRTRELLVRTVRACDDLGVQLLVVHTGAGGPQAREAALRASADSYRLAVDAAEDVRVVAELMAGTSGAVASLPHEAEALFAAVDDERLGLVVDTAHAFAAGVPIDDPAGVAAFADELRQRGLASRLALVHANDSAFGRGEHRDRHANVGDGAIGEAGWRALATDPLLSSVPWILETPGDAERQRADIAHLRTLAGGTPAAPVIG